MKQTSIGGVTVQLRASGAMWIEAERMLVVADLHLEKGSAFARRGQLLPPWDTRETLDRLTREVEATDPAAIVFLGDALHDAGASGRLHAEDRERLEVFARERRLVWIAGNHDREGLDGLPGETTEEILIGDLVLRHEPRAGADHAWAAGHLHPCARVRSGGGGVRRRCFVTDGQRIVLPAFGAFTGGLNIRDKAYAGLFAGKPQAVVLGQARAYAVAWTSLRGD